MNFARKMKILEFVADEHRAEVAALLDQDDMPAPAPISELRQLQIACRLFYEDKRAEGNSFANARAKTREQPDFAAMPLKTFNRICSNQMGKALRDLVRARKADT